jgi:hypothetical protein
VSGEQPTVAQKRVLHAVAFRSAFDRDRLASGSRGVSRRPGITGLAVTSAAVLFFDRFRERRAVVVRRRDGFAAPPVQPPNPDYPP